MSSSTMSPMPAPMRDRSWTRGPLILVGGLVAAGVLALFGSQFVDPIPSHGESTPVASLELRFVDRANGGVGVLNAVDGSVVTEIQPGQDNFVRATMRGLARQRYREAMGADVPFRLTAWADGRLTLEDPATRRTVELESFGATNEADFSRMLKLVKPEMPGAPR
jgi:putative photosynthetic complex assembly protein